MNPQSASQSTTLENASGCFLCKTIEVENISQYCDGINEIHTGKLDALLVKGVFSQEEARYAVSRLQDKQDETIGVRYGATLGKAFFATGTPEEKREYIATAKRFRETLKTLFNCDVETRVGGILSSMAGGRKVEIANEGSACVYTPLTIRFVREGMGGMVVHRGDEFLVDKALCHLNKVAQMTGWVSFFIVLQNAKEGGELVLYDVPDEDYSLNKQELDFDSYPHQRIQPSPGDMILFHGGRIFHQVLDIKGDVDRITIGGFTTLSKDDTKVFYWS